MAIAELHHPGLGAPVRLARFDRERVGRLQSASAQSKPRNSPLLVQMAQQQQQTGEEGALWLGGDLLISCHRKLYAYLSGRTRNRFLARVLRSPQRPPLQQCQPGEDGARLKLTEQEWKA